MKPSSTPRLKARSRGESRVLIETQARPRASSPT
jgi:hypothetical protein